MDRRYFRKNVNQTDLFDLQLQLDDIKKLRNIESELLMIDLLSLLELEKLEEKQVNKKTKSQWTQVSVESLFDIPFS